MNMEPELPPDVTAAIRANRKIDAIKLLRQHRDLGLKEAKHAVEAYARANPQLVNAGAPKTESGIGRLILIVIVVVVVYAAYRNFSQT